MDEIASLKYKYARLNGTMTETMEAQMIKFNLKKNLVEDYPFWFIHEPEVQQEEEEEVEEPIVV
jgi:hypothetical protein